MKKTSLLLLFGLFILRGPIFAQNPYESLGKIAPVLTLSAGKYEEFMTNDTLVHIGSVLFNTLTHEVVAFVDDDSVRLMEADMTTRFLSVDPLGRKFPELTPYQFAGNTPIQAIDLDGLEPFYVMGTNQEQTYDKTGYGKKEGEPSGNPTTFTKPMLENMNYVATNIATSAHKTPLDTGFSWEGLNGTTNDVNDRQKAAELLVKYVTTNHVKGEPITLIGYSHGGNVALQAAPMIYKQLGVKVNIITINTPASNVRPVSIASEIPGAYTITVDPPRWVENPDNGLIQQSVNSMYHLYTKGTDWTVKGSWFLERSSNSYESTFPTTIQTETNENCANHGNIYCPDTISKGFEESKQPRQPAPPNND